MKLLVVGASGAVGSELVRVALDRGHEVRAFVRDPAKLGDLAARIDVHQGALDDAAALLAAVDGMDGVASCVGPMRNDRAEPVRFRAYMEALTEAMRARSVRRVVAISGTSSRIPGPPWPLGRRIFSAALHAVLPHMLAAHQAQIDVLLASELEWVVARCPDMRSGPPRGVVALPDQYPGWRIMRSDLARFLLDQLTDPTWLRQAPIVASAR